MQIIHNKGDAAPEGVAEGLASTLVNLSTQATTGTHRDNADSLEHLHLEVVAHFEDLAHEGKLPCVELDAGLWRTSD